LSERKFAAEFFDTHVGVHGGQILPHQATYRQVADPATSAALRMVSPRRCNRHVANE